MKSYKFLIVIFVVLFSVLLLCVRYGCRTNEVCKVISDTVTVFRDSPTLTEVRVVEVPNKIDTVEVIRAYYETKIYVDTVRANEYVTVVISDTVSLNSLDGQALKVYTRIPEPKQNMFNLRCDAGLGMCGLGLEYRYKRWGVFGGYNFAQRTPVVGLNYSLLTW